MKIKQPKDEIKSIADYMEPFREPRKNINDNPVPNNNHTSRLDAALERAWKNRDFEIDKYWSRATYFWAFIASAFVGYISTISSDKIIPNFKEAPFLLACIGLLFSVAWVFVNEGSKKWQENWEKHIDMLEDDVTGPLYKTTTTRVGYSVSKINKKVSEFVLSIWAILVIKDIVPWGFPLSQWKFSTWKFLFLLSTLCFSIIITRQNDKNREDKTFSFFRRRNKE